MWIKMNKSYKIIEKKKKKNAPRENETAEFC